jgi:hypothetical protein
MSKELEIIKIKFSKDKKVNISILGNKLFEIPANDIDFENEKEYIFKEKLPAQAQMLLNMLMQNKLK